MTINTNFLTAVLTIIAFFIYVLPFILFAMSVMKSMSRFINQNGYITLNPFERFRQMSKLRKTDPVYKKLASKNVKYLCICILSWTLGSSAIFGSLMYLTENRILIIVDETGDEILPLIPKDHRN